MKMSRQNPGGEGHTHPTMKGVEKYMKKGKGGLNPSGYHCGGMTKFSMGRGGLEGIVPAGKARGK